MDEEPLEFDERLSSHYDLAKLYEDSAFDLPYENLRVISESELLAQLKQASGRYQAGPGRNWPIVLRITH